MKTALCCTGGAGACFRRYLTKANVARCGKIKLAVFDIRRLAKPGLDSKRSESAKELGSVTGIEGDVVYTMETLKQLGLKIAICTEDERFVAKRKTSEMHLSDLIDVMKCADDQSVLKKPHPSNIDSICAEIGVRPVNVAVIGEEQNGPLALFGQSRQSKSDTVTDMELGKYANVGLTVAIQKIGTFSGLPCMADETVYRIEETIPLLTRC